jgi:hypothetical protein
MHRRIILKMNVTEIEYESMEWIHQAQDDSTKVRESGGQLSDCSVLKTDLTS